MTILASEAHRSASRRAGEVGVRWASVHFHLRVRDEGVEPVWLLTFVNRAQVRVGQVYLSVRTGDILRRFPALEPHRTENTGRTMLVRRKSDRLGNGEG